MLTDRTVQLFGTKGQEFKGTGVPSLSLDIGTMGQAQNLAKGRDGPGQPKSGTRDKTGQSRKGCSKTLNG